MLSKEEAFAKVVTGEEVKSACLSKKDHEGQMP